MRGKLPTTGTYSSRPLSDIQGITVHYTAGYALNTVEEVARFQLTRDAAPGLKFPAIAYTFMVTYDGQVSLCHDLDTKCWHSGAVISGVSRNTSHVGICWTGIDVPTPAQIQGIKQARDYVRQQLNNPSLPVEGHREAPYATACPGARYKEWIDLVR